MGSAAIRRGGDTPVSYTHLVIAYILGEEARIEETAARLSEMNLSDVYTRRAKWVELLLHAPENDRQKKLLLSFLGDRETSTRQTAYRLVEKLELSDEDYRQIDRKSTRLNSSHSRASRMPSSA